MASQYGAVSTEDIKDRGIELPLDDAPPTIRNACMAILFVIHFVVVIILGVLYGSFDSPTNDEAIQSVPNEVSKVITHVALPSSVIAFILSYFMTGFVLPRVASFLVKGTLLGSFVITAGLGTAACISYSSWVTYVSVTLILLLETCYVYSIWRYIPFTTVNLKVAIKGMTQNCAAYGIALFVTVLMFLWGFFWLFVFHGVWMNIDKMGKDNDCFNPYVLNKENLDCTRDLYDHSYFVGLNIFLFISLYWTMMVLYNIGQVTVVGIMATWCFDIDDADSCWSPSVTSSFVRSTWYSFGSICFGSLLTTLIRAIRAIIDKFQRDADSDGDNCDANSICMCCVQCCFSCFEGAFEYFNDWAYVYIGVYGEDYLTSGRKVMEMFGSRGWTSLITCLTIEYPLAFISLTVSSLAGAIAMVIDNNEIGEDGLWDSFWIGFIIAFLISQVMMNVIKGATKTVIVCFADKPKEFSENHPELVMEMVEAWLEAFPDCGVEVPGQKSVEASIV